MCQKQHSDRRAGIALLILFAVQLPALAQSPDQAKPTRAVLESRGYVIPIRQVRISSLLPGRIIELRIEEGKVVKSGEVLARLDPTTYELELQQAQAKLEEVKARLGNLKSTDERAIINAQVKEATTKVRLAQYRLDNTVIRASVPGTILAKHREVGEVVLPESLNSPASICEIADLSNLAVEIDVLEGDLGMIFRGQKCWIQVVANANVKYAGTVSRLMPVADRAKGAVSVLVKLDLPKNGESLRPESAAMVQFLAKE